MPVTQCFLCGSKDLVKILDLGFHTPADLFLKEHQLMGVERRYPLQLLLCRACGHAMNSYVVSPQERYQENDYSFESSHSQVSVGHFANMAADVAAKAEAAPGDLVVDIGSNVGTLLGACKKLGLEVQGVDPAPNIAAIAEKNGIPTINDFFGPSARAQILQKKGKAKVITAVNCFNHVANLKPFMQGIVSILHERGVFVIESPHFLQFLKRMQFDTAYHEHVSYLAVKPLCAFMKKFGLTLMHAEEDEYLGGVIRMYVGYGNENASVGQIIKKEEQAKLFDEKTFVPYARKVFECKLRLLKDLVDARAQGGKVVAIGAAAKGNTLLNYCGIDHSLVDFATDVSPLKIGKYTPGSHLPIRSDDAIDESITHALILAWNLSDMLKSKIAPKHPKLQFITPHVVVE